MALRARKRRKPEGHDALNRSRLKTFEALDAAEEVSELRDQLLSDLSEPYPEREPTFPAAPKERLAQNLRLHGDEMAMDYILRMLHKFMLRGTPTDVIASTFDVGIETIYGWQKLLKKKYQEDSKFFDEHGYIGEGLGHFAEVQQLLWQELGENGLSSADKVRILVALANAKVREAQFLRFMGVTEAKQYKGQVAGYGPADDAKDIFDRVEDILITYEDRSSRVIEGSYRTITEHPDERKASADRDD